MITATSRIATIAFDGRTVTITRKRSGFVDRGTRTISLDHIAGVQFKEAGLVSSGYIRIVQAGTLEHRGHRTGAFATEVLKDENAVPFGRPQQEQFAAVKAAIDQALAQRTTGAPAAGSLADEIAKLQQLLTTGALTQAEFEQAKARLLSQ